MTMRDHGALVYPSERRKIMMRRMARRGAYELMNWESLRPTPFYINSMCRLGMSFIWSHSVLMYSKHVTYGGKH